MISSSPLKGLLIIDAGTMLAAPWSATHLADFGARVIKVEHPKFGDHARQYGMKKEGKAIFWKSLNRNKESVTLNLSQPEGQAIFKELIAKADVLIENFRPGTLEKWGLSWETLSAINPSLVLLRTTGFGQDGPYASRRGFGTVTEGMSGFTSVNGAPDGPPMLPGIPLADGITGSFGALAIMIAIYARNNHPERLGQQIDISLYEPLMRFLEPHLLAYDQLGVVAQRKGNASVQTAPRNAYQTKDEHWVALSASAQPIAENVFRAIDREELITHPDFKDNQSRLKNVKALDAIIGDWIAQRDLTDVVAILNESGAVVGPMYTVEQLYQDPHYVHRESFVEVDDSDFGMMKMPNVFAKMSRTPGEVTRSAPQLGEHTASVYQEFLGMTPEVLQALKDQDII